MVYVVGDVMFDVVRYFVFFEFVVWECVMRFFGVVFFCFLFYVMVYCVENIELWFLMRIVEVFVDFV